MLYHQHFFLFALTFDYFFQEYFNETLKQLKVEIEVQQGYQHIFKSILTYISQKIHSANVSGQ